MAPAHRESRVVHAAKSNDYNDVSRFLAGLPVQKESPLHVLTQTPEWQKYASEFERTYKKSVKEQFEPIDGFQQSELAPRKTGSQYVFYPFSGPDVLYMNRFFPDAKVYVMIAREPVGSIEKPTDYTQAQLEADLNSWKKGLASIFERSFFVTLEMDHYFRREVSDGLLPTIAILLARSGYEVDAVRYGQVNSEGQFEPEPGGVAKHKGVEVTFRAEGSSETKKLYYLSTDLAEKFATNEPVQKFLKGLGRSDTLVKSASFLLHWKMCVAARDFILANSNLILQDDTGVPYKVLKKAGFQVQLYGVYSEPDKPFKKQYQEDLAADFSNPALVKPLPFRIGYGFKRRPSSMLLAVKAPSAATAVAAR